MSVPAGESPIGGAYLRQRVRRRDRNLQFTTHDEIDEPLQTAGAASIVGARDTSPAVGTCLEIDGGIDPLRRNAEFMGKIDIAVAVRVDEASTRSTTALWIRSA